MVSANAKWQTIQSFGFLEQPEHSFRLVVIRAMTKGYEAAVSIYCSMNNKSPPNQFVGTIEMPNIVWRWTPIRSSTDSGLSSIGPSWINSA